MSALRFTQHIDAVPEKVWHALLDDRSYREWTAPFNPGGSFFRGDWQEGSEIRFIGPDEQGREGGMIATVVENRPNEFVMVRHLGQIVDGKDDFDSEAVKPWIGATETYTLERREGGTLVTINLTSGEETSEQMVEFMQNAWPNALAKLKEIAERT